MPISDILIILKVYLVSLVLQAVGLPLTKKLFPKLPDNGYALSRITTSLIASLLVWETANLGLATNTNLGLWSATGVVVAIDLLIVFKEGLKFLKISRETLKLMVMEEYLFLVGLSGMAIVRAFLPNIDSLEKFMDYGFVKSYLVSPTLPATDMWQAGKAINYYSFGHFWASELIRYFNIPPSVGYNMLLSFIAGISLSLSFCVSHLLSGAKKGIAGMIAGVTGAMAVVLAGNTHVVWYLFSNKSLASYWYADATRFIHNTIHEFPSYSFVVADLHGHLLDLPMALSFILVFLHWLHSRSLLDEIIMGVLFGVMMMTNTWDVAVYGLMLSVAGGFLVLSDRHNLWKLTKSAGVILLFMVLTALPWFISFQSISSGIKMVQERSPLWQLAVLWSGGTIVCLFSVITEGKGGYKLPIRTLVITVFLLILIPELVYAKDIYPDHPRANTMFKLTYQASVMIGLLLGSLMGKLFDGEKKLYWWWRSFAIVVISFIFVGTLIFPAEAFPNFYANFEKYQGLDGETWMKQKMSDRYKVIEYLKENMDGRNLMEAVGDSYTNYNAIPVFTGIPAVQGWRVHEWLWRNGYDSVAVREADVQNFYEHTNQEFRNKILAKYNIGWIVVGEDERNMYTIDEESIKKIGEVIEFGETYLIKVR